MITKVVYIAGPFRGAHAWEIEQNIRNAETLALEVWACGAAALCPHTNTRFFQGTLPDETWLEGDLVLLERCDALLAHPEWTRSVGASKEVAHALNRGIPVFYDLPALKDWLAFRRLAEA